MPELFPGALIPWIEQRFLDAEGNPLAGGSVESLVAGTSTPQATYTDVDLSPGSEHTNPILLDVDGRPPDPIYLAANGYKFIVRDVNNVELYTIDNIEDIGQVFAANFGVLMAEGGKNEVSGYQVLPTDRLVTMNSTGGADPCVVNLLAVADATQELTIKNMGTEPLAVTPDGADTIDGLAAVFTVAAAASPNFPAITLRPYPPSAWFIVGSHGL